MEVFPDAHQHSEKNYATDEPGNLCCRNSWWFFLLVITTHLPSEQKLELSDNLIRGRFWADSKILQAFCVILILILILILISI